MEIEMMLIVSSIMLRKDLNVDMELKLRVIGGVEGGKMKRENMREIVKSEIIKS